MPQVSVHRSGLTMPVNTPRFVDAAWTRGCDFINLDLEDSVPLHQKGHARTLVREAILKASKGGAEIHVRINHDFVEADLDAVVWPGLDRVNYPKAETAEEIYALDKIITRLERERGMRPGTIEIGPNIETAKGAAAGCEIASASPRIKDFGGAVGYDMSRDLGVEMFVGFDQFVYSKGEVELIARALDLEPRGGPFVPNTTGSVSDPERAFEEAESARKCGFRIGGGLHPNVVEPQNKGFTPTPAEVEEACHIVEHFRDLESAGFVWQEIDGHIIDKYESRRAQSLLEWANACASKDDEKASAVARSQSSVSSVQ